MEKKKAIIFIIGIIVVSGIAGGLLGYYSANSFKNSDAWEDATNQTMDGKGRNDRDKFETSTVSYITMTSALSMINMAISGVLIVMYIKMYRKVKTTFTLALLLLMITMFLYSLSSSPVLHMLFGFHALGMGPFEVIPALLSSVALSILLYISFE